MRLCDPAEALGQVWHILDVLDGSPAEVSRIRVSDADSMLMRGGSVSFCVPEECRSVLALMWFVSITHDSYLPLPPFSFPWLLLSTLDILLYLLSTSLELLTVLPGLIPYGDYVVGWTEGALHAESDFYDLVEHVSLDPESSSLLLPRLNPSVSQCEEELILALSVG
jgi:hypothetical protein